jgi:hypothetical protein
LVLSLGRPAPSHSLYTLMLSCSLYTLSTLSFHSIPLCSPCVDPFSWLGSRPLVPLIPSTSSCSAPSCSTPSRLTGSLSCPFHFSPFITHALSIPVPSYAKRYPLVPSRFSQRLGLTPSPTTSRNTTRSFRSDFFATLFRGLLINMPTCLITLLINMPTCLIACSATPSQSPRSAFSRLPLV